MTLSETISRLKKQFVEKFGKAPNRISMNEEKYRQLCEELDDTVCPDCKFPLKEGIFGIEGMEIRLTRTKDINIWHYDLRGSWVGEPSAETKKILKKFRTLEKTG